MKKVYGVLSQGLRKKGKVRDTLYLGNRCEEVDRKKKANKFYNVGQQGATWKRWKEAAENAEWMETVQKSMPSLFKHTQKKRYWKNSQEELDFCNLKLKMWEVLWWRLHRWLCWKHHIQKRLHYHIRRTISFTMWLSFSGNREGSPGQVIDWPICVSSILLF